MTTISEVPGFSPTPSAKYEHVNPDCHVEVLIPDFQGIRRLLLKIVLDARPHILNHNTETVPRLYRVARSGARYPRTLKLLGNGLKRFSPDTVRQRPASWLD